MIPSNIRKYKKSVRRLPREMKKNIISKSKTLGKRKAVNTNLEPEQTLDDLKQEEELERVKLVDEPGTTIRLKSRRSRKNSGRESENVQSIKLEDHVDVNLNVESQENENIKRENDETSKRTLKRKRPAKDEDSKSSPEQRKRKKVGKNNKENTDTFNLSDLLREHITLCISAIFHLTEEQLKAKNALFEGESHPVFMQVTCIRVPKTPRRCMRILLPHSMVSSNDEIALFVGDRQRGRRKDYEPTVEYYQDLLSKHDCTIIKSIIPMNQVKTEYDQYELKRKLVNSYDHFLVDGKIAGHMSHLLGREFYKKRKLPTSIRMQSKDLKHEIEYALRKTGMELHSYGDTHIVQVGHTFMKEEEILENVLAVCSYLSKNYPGGWVNIRSVRIKTTTSLALPIYTTLRNKNSVKVPSVQPKRPKAYRDVKGEISTVSGNAIATVTPEGTVTVKRKEKKTKIKHE